MGGDAVGTLNQFLKFSFAPVLAWRYDLCLRQMFLISQTEDLLYAVFDSLEGLVHLACWLHDLLTPSSRDPVWRIAMQAQSNSTFEFTSASSRWDIKHNRCFIVPVHADGAGGSAMF